ncbi:MAG: non-canonical purine NTP pyrophosphatase [Gemmatimonadales bacterium]
MKLLVATRSEGKKREVRRLVADTGIEVTFPDEAGVRETPEEELLETGDSFESNARHKAEYFARKTGLPTVADDSGLEVLSLGGAPGVRSRRFAGATGDPAVVDAANNAELLRRLAGAPASRRRARYRCVLVYLSRPGAIPQVFDGTCNGAILEQPRGEGGFGYDPLFLSDDLGRSFGEADPADKDRVSHRGRAWAALVKGIGE